ncbi:hypothetical protein BGZ57DRAFT_980045, partial [Hyaloscypha finlandica]
IVFVHGLNGHPRNTFQHDETLFFWPRELGNDLKECRIMTFGYDASITIMAQKSLMGIHDHATSLLGRVRNERATMAARNRPLVFICHSLGGLVVKEALLASQNDPNYKSIHQATRAVFFFGTPHRGAAALDTKRLSFLMNVARLSFTRIPQELENSLRTRSTELFSINDRFRHISTIHTLIITCFYERSNDESIISPVTNITQVVDKDSAVLGYTNEESIAVATDHRGLVRYQDVNDDNFDFVRKTILVKVEDILSA